MADVVDRLREYEITMKDYIWTNLVEARSAMIDAVDEIETLRTDLANEREAHALVIKECNRLKKLGQESAAQVRSEMI